MKITEILREGISPILFHATHVNSVITMLRSGSLELSPSPGEDHYYMSFARSRTGEFTKYLASLSRGDLEEEKFNPHQVYTVVEFDGVQLMNNLTGGSVNAFHDPDEPELTSDYDFMEDRIISKKPRVALRAGYIREIHFVINADPRVEKVLKIANRMEQGGVTVSIYADTDKFMSWQPIEKI